MIIVGVVAVAFALFVLLLMAHRDKGSAMRVTDLVRDMSDGSTSLVKTVSLWSALVLSVAFVKDAWTHDLGWEDYIGYAIASAAAASPTLAGHLISAKFGAKTENGGPKP